MASSAIGESRRLGPWTIEPSLGRVRRGSHIERIEPRVMAVLLALTEKPGETVARGQLVQTVWGDTAVTDDALQRCVSILRRTLGRGEHGVRIETIPKVGYRLVVQAPDAPAAAEQTRPARGVLLGVAATLGLAAIAGAMWPASTPPPANAIRPITTWPGHEMDPSLSPDASHVAYIRRAQGSQDLYVTVGTGTPLRLTATDGNEHSPAYAPDGATVAYARTGPDGRCEVVRIAVTKGPEQKLLSCRHAAKTELAWSPDGRRLAYLDRDSPSAPIAVKIVDIESGKVSGPPPASVGHRRRRPCLFAGRRHPRLFEKPGPRGRGRVHLPPRRRRAHPHHLRQHQASRPHIS